MYQGIPRTGARQASGPPGRLIFGVSSIRVRTGSPSSAAQQLGERGVTPAGRGNSR
ncbi:hypothetical protein ACRRTK_020399 [Alexandromys fortis]